MYKDIQLKLTEHGQYDREFHINDFKTVTGLETIKNKIIISLMTRLGELSSNPTYQNFGCKAHTHLKEVQTPLTKIAIQENIKTSLENIKDIKTVANVYIGSDPSNLYSLKIFFTLIFNNNVKIKDRIEIKGI